MEMLKKASHPNIVQVFELFDDGTHYYIVTEYFKGEDLLKRIRKQIKSRVSFSEDQICHIMRAILEGINYCHKINICHRDIKPENILINDSNEIKIIDLGLSDIVIDNENSLRGRKGTKRYMAPEVFNG